MIKREFRQLQTRENKERLDSEKLQQRAYGLIKMDLKKMKVEIYKEKSP